MHEIEQDMYERKRIWTRPWPSNTYMKGGTATVLSEFETEDLKEYRSFMRMEVQQFDRLLEGE